MTARKFNTVLELCADVRQLRDRLLKHNEVESAKDLEDTIKHPWATSGEWVDEIIESLLRVRPAVERNLGKDAIDLLDAIVLGATKLFSG